jgi:hypothetical protein
VNLDQKLAWLRRLVDEQADTRQLDYALVDVIEELAGAVVALQDQLPERGFGSI